MWGHILAGMVVDMQREGIDAGTVAFLSGFIDAVSNCSSAGVA